MRRRWTFVGLAVLAGACATPDAAPTLQPEVQACAPLEEPASTPEQLYERAVAIARYPDPERVADALLALDPANPALRFDEDGRVLVSTWTRARYYEDPRYRAGYAFELYGETWFTTGGEVQAVCRASELEGDELDLRLEQLLGLPPGGSNDAFLQVWIDPEQLFRPCADPSVTTASCPISAPLTLDDSGAVSWACEAPATGHQQWLCNSWVLRYGSSDPLRQYPWTALGYTYDWSPKNPTGQGPSEFVAPAESPVVFEALVATGAFCR